jgi:small subunit ribosomal protein S18
MMRTPVERKVFAVPDYKEAVSLKRFVTDRGKLLPAKKTGVTAKMQKEIARQVKRARFMALLPYTDRHAL